MKTYLKYLFQLILSPRHGWEDIEKDEVSPSHIAVTGFYPLIAVAAVSVFIQMLFRHHTEFLTMFMRMLITFVVYFISYFFGTFILSVFVEPLLASRYDEDRCHTFTLYTLGLLALISILINCLPVTPLLLFFLPFYVALIQWKGVGYMQVKPDKTGLFMIIAILGVLMPPYLFYFLFTLIF